MCIMCLKLSKATSTVQNCIVDKSDQTMHFVRRQKKIKLRTEKGKKTNLTPGSINH